MEQRSDAEWIRALKQSDPSALDDLWTSLHRAAAYLAPRYGRDEVAAEKAVVNAYERILQRGVYQYRFTSSFRWYCRTILAHEVLRQLDAREIPLPNEDLPLPPVLPSELTLSTLTFWETVQPCFALLTRRQTTVIEMRYVSDLRPQTVAERLGITRNNVNKVAYDARRKLKRCLEGLGYRRVADLF